MIARAADGYYHPASVDELAELVRFAHKKALPLRVRGAEHSVAAAVHNDGFDGAGAPPDGPIEVMMDGLRRVAIEGKGDHAIAEVEGGCHLGRYPYDPPRTSSWANSLNYQLQQAGWALDDLGGISHQTVTGFMLTGSSGGSIEHTLANDIVRMLLIDGSGTVHDLRADDPDPEKSNLFHAAGVSMGLLGVVAKVWLRAGKSYNVVGNEITTKAADCHIDLFGEGGGGKKSLAQHLRDVEYCRLLWWPQHDFDRVQVWQGERQEPGTPGYQHKPFQILTKVEALAGSLFMTVIGNLEDPTVVPAKLKDWFRHLESSLDGDDEDVNACVSPQRGGKVELEDVLAVMQGRFARAIERHPEINEGDQHRHEDLKELWKHRGDDAPDEGLPHGLARAITQLFRLAINGLLDSWLGKILGKWLAKRMPGYIDELLGPFVEIGQKDFADTWMCALPMDNQMDDELWPTEFTELWLPIEHTTEAMQRLREHFAAGGDVELAFRRTRAYATELYACGKSPFWLSPAYQADCFRVDPFWFSHWAGHPNDEMFPPIYDMLADLGWRPHWGKHLPPPDARWHAHYRKVLPQLEQFLAFRKQLDPKDIFLTTYWREHLGVV